MKSIRILILTLLVLSVTAFLMAEEHCGACQNHQTAQAKSQPAVTKTKAATLELAGYGKKNMLADGVYFTYEFTKKPKMGQNILKVQIFDQNKKPVTNYQLSASWDMPSMKGMHNFSDKKFQLNNKGYYLLPVDFVMPGGWQVDLKLISDKNVTTVGSFQLKI